MGLERGAAQAEAVSHPLPWGEESKKPVTFGIGFWEYFTARGEELAASPNKK